MDDELTKQAKRALGDSPARLTQTVWIAVQQAQAAGLTADAIYERLTSIASDVLADAILDRQAARGSRLRAAA